MDEVSFDNIIHPIAQKILFNFSNHLKKRITFGTITKNQFTEQAIFPMVLPLFEFKKEYELSKYDKTMIASSLKPDFLVRLSISKAKQIDFFIVGIKKPSGNVYSQYESNFIKVHREMKQIIDAQNELGIHNPVSYSLLVEGKCWACSSLGLNGHSLIFWV
jgi:hypothetical protein